MSARSCTQCGERAMCVCIAPTRAITSALDRYSIPSAEMFMMEREGTVEEKGGKKGKRVRSLSNCNVSDWEIRNPRGGRWSQAEHERFLAGFQRYGNKWKLVQECVKTRSVTQTRTHAQKFLQKLQKRTGHLSTLLKDGKRTIKIIAKKKLTKIQAVPTERKVLGDAARLLCLFSHGNEEEEEGAAPSPSAHEEVTMQRNVTPPRNLEAASVDAENKDTSTTNENVESSSISAAFEAAERVASMFRNDQQVVIPVPLTLMAVKEKINENSASFEPVPEPSLFQPAARSMDSTLRSFAWNLSFVSSKATICIPVLRLFTKWMPGTIRSANDKSVYIVYDEQPTSDQPVLAEWLWMPDCYDKVVMRTQEVVTATWKGEEWPGRIYSFMDNPSGSQCVVKIMGVDHAETGNSGKYRTFVNAETYEERCRYDEQLRAAVTEACAVVASQPKTSNS